MNILDLLGDFPNRLPIGEAAPLGGIVTLLGVVIVFLALVCLIILTIVYPKFFGWLLTKSTASKAIRAEKKAVKKLAKSKAKQLDNPQKAETSISVNKPEAKQAPVNDGELIAVITAAIAASLGTSSNGIRIKSLRRTGSNTPAWGRKGKIEQFRF